MKVLIIKTSSMGDVIHLLPALTDAGKALPSVRFDWVIEEAFAEIPRWHPLVERVIPIAWRRWRKQPWQLLTGGAWSGWGGFYRQLRQEQYDYVLDAQGLLKSAWLTWLSRGIRCGLDWHSARERWAALAYQRRYKVIFAQHAIVRMRQLLSLGLNYPLPHAAPVYGLDPKRFALAPLPETVANYLIFIHNASAARKLWPTQEWIALARLANAAGYAVYLPWGTSDEHQRALQIAAQAARVYVLPKLTLGELAAVLANAGGVVAVDTGLGHLAAALSVPAVSLYFATDPRQIGTVGDNQQHLALASLAKQIPTEPTAVPAFLPRPLYLDAITPAAVWQALNTLGVGN